VPELPEVETVVRGLAPALVGRRVRAVTVRDPRLRGGVARDFAARLTGREIRAVGRQGKYFLATLDDGRIWLVHLGMTGRLTLETSGRAPRALHDHVVVKLDDGRTLTYNDARRFGRMAVIDPAALPAETGEGIDALAPAFTPQALFVLTRRRRTSIKSLLMDQRRIAGLGNIYVNEILFGAGIRPGRRAGRLGRAECERIVAATSRVLAEAIRGGGSSISDYRDGLGQSGWFQLRHQVYDRAGEPCRRCRAPIRARVIVGRSSFYCPRCQR
jgi:formamidopyrimidine-DNA glycosylase